MGNRYVCSRTVLLIACGIWLGVGWNKKAESQQVATGSAVRSDALRVSVSLENVPLRVAIKKIATQAELRASYDETVIPEHARVTLRAADMPAADAFRQALLGTGLAAEIQVTGNVLIFVKTNADQSGEIVGKVISAKTKQPVIGATVLLDSATQGGITRADGTFRLSATTGEHVIHVRAVGLVKQSRRVMVSADATVSVEFVLEQNASVLDEVVVTGTIVATERRAIPNPITIITAEDIERRGITRIEDLLRGEVPGVVALEQGSTGYDSRAPGLMAKSNVYARGVTQIASSENTPLKTYVDGVELVDANYLGTIDPQSIERIEIITGPQAATVYGSGAIGGVMQIFTKRGGGTVHSDLSIRYGILQNDFNQSLTPAHRIVGNVTGGEGALFSYAINGSHEYIGQWRPGLFSRSIGGSLGVNHERGAIRAGGSVSVTFGRNGTYSGAGSGAQLGVKGSIYCESGEWNPGPGYCPKYKTASYRRSQSFGLNLAFNVDHRIRDSWRQHITVGRNQTNFMLDPSSPIWDVASDSLYGTMSSDGSRLTVAYNTTWMPLRHYSVRPTLVAGITGSSKEQTSIDGCLASTSSSEVISCSSGSAAVDVRRDIPDRSFGGFVTTQISFYDWIFLTGGIRGEHNDAYGEDQVVDWTPTLGVTSTFELDALALKALASYGRATRAPRPEQRLAQMSSFLSSYTPSQYLLYKANPELRAERSRGPQVGVELYYGNLGSVTVTHYRQVVTDLIMSLTVDSNMAIYNRTGSPTWFRTRQYVNAADISQNGWEVTGTANLASFTVKGTYSWTDNRVRNIDSRYVYAGSYPKGHDLSKGPNHLGGLTLSYARSNTSLMLTTSFIGQRRGANAGGPQGDLLHYESTWSRIRTYVRNVKTLNWGIADGYTRSDLSISHRVTPAISALFNVKNLQNSFASDVNWFNPTLGRQTFLGISIRYPTH